MSSRALVAELSASEIAALARHFARQPPSLRETSAATAGDAALVEDIRALAEYYGSLGKKPE